MPERPYVNAATHWFLGAILSICCGSSVARASEGQIFGGPIGGTDIRTAYIPPLPGFYGGLVGAAALADKAYGDNGEQNKAVHVNVPLGLLAGGITYVYPFKLFGGTMSSTLQDQFLYGRIVIAGKGQYFNGVGDLYAELLGWSRHIGPQVAHVTLPYGLTVKLSYSMIFPIGEYITKDIFPIGHNDFFFIPNAAVTYLTRSNAIGDGVEYSLHGFLDLATTNTATDYHTGPVADLDFAVSNRFGRTQFGAAGYYAMQLSDDRVGGRIAPPNGKELEALYLGPVFAYDMPAQRATLKLKLQLPIIVRNGLNAKRLFLIYGFAF